MSYTTSETPPYTIEELIEALTRIADARGWGLQSLTNIAEIAPDSDGREVSLLTGQERNIEELDNELAAASRDVRNLGQEVENLEIERDALKRAVERLSHELLILKGASSK